MQRAFSAVIGLLSALSTLSCSELDMSRDVGERPSMGAIVYEEVCQRVVYTSELEQFQRGERDAVDVSGAKYHAFCYDNAAAPPDASLQVKALPIERQVIIEAVDLVLPDSILKSVKDFLAALVPVSENGSLSDVANKLADLLLWMHDNNGFAAALSRLGYRGGYRPLADAAGALSVILAYPDMGKTLQSTLTLVGDGGAGKQALANLTTALSYEMRTMKANAQPSDPERNLRIGINFLFSKYQSFADGRERPVVLRDWRGMAGVVSPGGQVPSPFVDKTHSGLPDINDQGQFIGSDGLPLSIGAPFPVPGQPDQFARDALGRYLGASGQVYRYVDLDGTVLKGTLSELHALMDPALDIVFGLLSGAEPLLGMRLDKTKHYDLPSGGMDYQFTGFDQNLSAVLDIFHGLAQMLANPQAKNSITIARTLFVQYESELARVLKAVLDVSDRAKKYPTAQIPPTSNLFDDLNGIIVRVLEVPGLLEDLMDALDDPHVKGLAKLLGYETRYRDRFILNQDTLEVEGDWSTPVDRGAVDSNYNRSLLQRMAHLITDANGTRFCNKNGAAVVVSGIHFGTFNACEMFQVDDLALFFILTMADKSGQWWNDAKLNRKETTYNKASFLEQITSPALYAIMPDNGITDALLENLTEIPGFGRFPTSAAASRTLFLDENHKSAFLKGSTDDTLCIDGDRFIDVHNDSIFVWEQPVPSNPSGYDNDSFYDAVRPLITAFAKHDECLLRDTYGVCTKKQNAAKIFLDMMAVLHHHWGTPNSTYFGHAYQADNPSGPRYSAGDSAVTYEPLLAETMIDSDLMPAMLVLVPTLDTMTIDGTPQTPRAFPALQETLSYVFDPAAQPSKLAYRNGQQVAYKSDGVHIAGPVTPYYLIADGFARKRSALESAATTQQNAWKNAMSNLADQFLGVEQVGGRYRLKDRNAYGLAVTSFDFLLSRLAAHTTQGDVADWAHKRLTVDLTDLLDNPLVAALVDLSLKVEADEAARTGLYGLFGYVLNSTNQNAFSTMLTTLADVMQAFFDDADFLPLAGAVGEALDPGRGIVPSVVNLAQQSLVLDPGCAQGACIMTTLARNLFQNTPSGVMPAGNLADAVAEINRAVPGAGGHLFAADYSAAFESVRVFLIDNQRGLGKAVDLIQHRLGNR